MAEVHDSNLERTKKRDPGKITRAIKVALVGDGTVGKTCLLMSYVCQAFMEEYVPTMFDNFSTIEEVDGELVNVILWDTAGQEDYETIRTTTCFPNTHVFILCFSVVHPDSFHNVKQKWLEELRKSCPETPYILVGTKTDLRDDPETIKKLAEKNREPISSKVGSKRAKEIKAKAYLECNAKDMTTVNDIFKQALRVVMDPVKAQKKQVAKLAKKEEEIEKKIEKKIEKERKKYEEKERKKQPSSNNNNNNNNNSLSHNPSSASTNSINVGKQEESDDDDDDDDDAQDKRTSKQ